jgi:hypothetical protein
LASCQRGVQVDVRLHQRRGDQPSAQVDGLPRLLTLGGDEHTLVDCQVDSRRGPGQDGVAQQQVDHSAI